MCESYVFDLCWFCVSHIVSWVLISLFNLGGLDQRHCTVFPKHSIYRPGLGSYGHRGENCWVHSKFKAVVKVVNFYPSCFLWGRRQDLVVTALSDPVSWYVLSFVGKEINLWSLSSSLGLHHKIHHNWQVAGSLSRENMESFLEWMGVFNSTIMCFQKTIGTCLLLPVSSLEILSNQSSYPWFGKFFYFLN